MNINPDATPDEIRSALASRTLRLIKVDKVSTRLAGDIRALEAVLCAKTGGHDLRLDGVNLHSGQSRMVCRKCGTVEYK